MGDPSDDLGQIIKRIWEDIATDETAREAAKRIIEDVGTVAKRIGEVWPSYVGQLVKVAMKAAVQ